MWLVSTLTIIARVRRPTHNIRASLPQAGTRGAGSRRDLADVHAISSSDRRTCRWWACTRGCRQMPQATVRVRLASDRQDVVSAGTGAGLRRSVVAVSMPTTVPHVQHTVPPPADRASSTFARAISTLSSSSSTSCRSFSRPRSISPILCETVITHGRASKAAAPVRLTLARHPCFTVAAFWRLCRAVGTCSLSRNEGASSPTQKKKNKINACCVAH